MENPRIYLDTSVPSAFFDLSKPLRQHMTEKWFEHEAHHFDLYTSAITIQELLDWDNAIKRQKVIDLLTRYHVVLLAMKPNIIDLADEYRKKGAIPQNEVADALHIATAAINGIENLVSWNFKHIVSANPIRKIHQINQKKHLGIVEIGTIEMYGGYKYGSL